MLYILLIIIAVGVLLASEAGQDFLRVLGILALIAGGLYLAFWVVVIAIGLLSVRGIRDTIVTSLGWVVLVGFAVHLIYKAYKGFKNGDYTIQSIRQKLWREIKSWFIKWKHHKGWIIFIILSLVYTVYVLWLTNWDG